MNNIEPERIIFDTIVEFINRGDNTQTLLNDVRRYLKLKAKANMDLNKKYPLFQTSFKITDVFIQYTTDNAYPEHDISILEMMTPEGTIWQNDKDKYKKHFFGLLKLLFDHGARSIYHIKLQSEVPYLIFMALISPIHDTTVFNYNQINESVLERFLEVFIEQKVNKTFIDTLFNDVYEGNERLISIDTSLYIIKNFVVSKGYTLLHILIECGYSHYQHIIFYLLNRVGGNQILIDYNKNNPFYLALEVYKRENNNMTWFEKLLKPYLELIGKGLKINEYYFDEDLTTFMKLLEVYHEEKFSIIKTQLSDFIVIIMKKQRLKKTRKDKISPLLYFLNLYQKLYYYTHIEERKASYNNNVRRENLHVQFEGTVKLFHLFMKHRSEELFEVSKHNLSAFLYVLNLNLDHVSENDEYNKAIGIFKSSIDGVVDANIATNLFIDYYIIKEKQTRIDNDDLIDGIRINDHEIVSNLVQFNLFDVRGTQLDFKESKIDLKKLKNLPYEERFQKQILLRKQELQEKLKGKIPLLTSLIRLGTPALKLLGKDMIILLVHELKGDSYNLLYSVVEQDQYQDQKNKIFVNDSGSKIPLKMYIESIISNYQEKMNKLEDEINERSKYERVAYSSPIQKEARRISKIFFNLEYLWKERYTNHFEDYLYQYHFEYKQIKDTILQIKDTTTLEDFRLFDDRLAIKFMTKNGIEPEYAVKDEDEYKFNDLYPDNKPPYPYNVIADWNDYIFLWYPDKLTDEDCKILFHQLKQLTEEDEDVRMREMNDYYLTGSEMARRFEDI